VCVKQEDQLLLNEPAVVAVLVAQVTVVLREHGRVLGRVKVGEAGNVQ